MTVVDDDEKNDDYHEDDDGLPEKPDIFNVDVEKHPGIWEGRLTEQKKTGTNFFLQALPVEHVTCDDNFHDANPTHPRNKKNTTTIRKGMRIANTQLRKQKRMKKNCTMERQETFNNKRGEKKQRGVGCRAHQALFLFFCSPTCCPVGQSVFGHRTPSHARPQWLVAPSAEWRDERWRTHATGGYDR